jgi:kinesin family protein C2/C3
MVIDCSLGGDSKTLMFVQISPSINNANESIYSLVFASRVNNVELGQAKKHSEGKELAYYKNMVKRLEVHNVYSTAILRSLLGSSAS